MRPHFPTVTTDTSKAGEPHWFVAAGDGVTDDAQVFADAIGASVMWHEALGIESPEKLVAPIAVEPGRYYVGSQIDLRKGAIVGLGEVLLETDMDGVFIRTNNGVDAQVSSAAMPILKNIQINHQAGKDGAVGHIAVDMARPKTQLENVEIQFFDVGIDFTGPAYIQTITNPKIGSCNIGLRWLPENDARGENVRIMGGEISGNVLGVHCEDLTTDGLGGGPGFHFFGTSFDYNDLHVRVVRPTQFPNDVYKRPVFFGCWFESNQTDESDTGPRIDNEGVAAYIGCTFWDNVSNLVDVGREASMVANHISKTGSGPFAPDSTGTIYNVADTKRYGGAVAW